MNNGPIAPGTGSSLYGKKPSLRSSEESQFLWLIQQQIKNLTGVIANASALGPAVAVFTVNGGSGSPATPGNTWVIQTLNVQGKNPTFLLNGALLVVGTDYTWNAGTSTFTSTVPFVGGDIYSVIF